VSEEFIVLAPVAVEDVEEDDGKPGKLEAGQAFGPNVSKHVLGDGIG
jgi:hypothetical protein